MRAWACLDLAELCQAGDDQSVDEAAAESWLHQGASLEMVDGSEACRELLDERFGSPA